MSDLDAIVVGAGLAGLACTLRLQEAGCSVSLLEASDAVGGRVRTDEVDGFLLDRGFQILLTAYPEAKRQLDLDALDLREFEPGALVRKGGRFVRLADPYRQPSKALGALLAPIGTIGDKLRIGGLRRAVRRGSLDDLWQRPNQTTDDLLRERGLGTEIRDVFFRSWFGGVFFDRTLRTSSRMFEFVFRMFSEGAAAVPARGMQQIPAQLAARLSGDVLRLEAPVVSLEEDGVRLEGGERLRGRATVIATDAEAAARLLPEVHPPTWRGVTCVYFAAEKAPLEGPILALGGDEDGPVGDFHVATNVSSAYGPPGAALCAASVVDAEGLDDAALEATVRHQIRTWFGDPVEGWRHLRTYRIPHALPDQVPPALDEPRREVRAAQGRYVCGDHRDNASIDGALTSGRRCAEALLEDLG